MVVIVIVILIAIVGIVPVGHTSCANIPPLYKPITNDFSLSLCSVMSSHAPHPHSIYSIDKNQVCSPLLSDAIDNINTAVDVCHPINNDITSFMDVIYTLNLLVH